MKITTAIREKVMEDMWQNSTNTFYTPDDINKVLDMLSWAEVNSGADACSNNVAVAKSLLTNQRALKLSKTYAQCHIQAILSVAKNYACQQGDAIIPPDASITPGTTTQTEIEIKKTTATPTNMSESVKNNINIVPEAGEAFISQYKVPLIVAGVCVVSIGYMYFKCNNKSSKKGLKLSDYYQKYRTKWDMGSDCKYAHQCPATNNCYACKDNNCYGDYYKRNKEEEEFEYSE
ncbi:MAG: hypothetical protein LBO69_06695 [Ignavibacteria bacterium]|jgi:hypothetical protein|nr:hypothetical protein [Ignavibacteria bacterium]